MRYFAFISAILLTVPTFSQTTVTVDAANVLRTLSGHENGINVDYLMDGGYLTPSISSTQSLRNIKARLLRYPGGEKSDNYLFSKAPYISASPRMALTDTCFWPTNDYDFVDTNSAEKVCWPVVLDFDEFISMCHTTGATPLIVVAYDAAYNTRVCNGKPTKDELITNAVEWVRYANIKKGWNVKFWMIGNESWNSSEYNGKVTAQKYSDDLADFASAMKAVDPTIKIIANGQSGWWETILSSPAVSLIDFLGLSEYPVFNYTGGYDYYQSNNVDLTSEIDKAINDINSFAPAEHKSRIKVIASEYNSIDWGGDWSNVNNLGHAIANFQMFGDLVIKPELEAALMWNTRWVDNGKVAQSIYDAFDSEGNMNAIGKTINIWGTNLLSTIVFSTSNGTFVKSYASFDESDRKLNIFLINKDYTSRPVNLQIGNYENDFTGSVWQLTGTSVSDKFPVYEKTDSIFEPGDITAITLPPTSVTVLRLQPDNVVLPVKLMKFEAKKQHNDIALSWKISDEELISEIIIERSSDGEEFKVIGSVTSSNSDSTGYHFIDRGIFDLPLMYYRLTFVEHSGRKFNSRIISVSTGKSYQSILVQPNPFEGILNLKMISESERPVSIVISDVTGRIVYKGQKHVRKGINQFQLNLEHLRSGIYMLKAGDNSSVSTVKVVKR